MFRKHFLFNLWEILINKMLCLYSDDATLQVSASSKDDIKWLLCLSNLKPFFQAKDLTLNLSKTSYVKFNTNQCRNKTNLSIDQLSAQNVSNKTFFTLDSTLWWGKHSDKLISKSKSGLQALKRMSKRCTYNTFKFIYFPFVFSV